MTPNTPACQPADPDRLTLMLADLRLPSITSSWQTLAQRADTEGWPAARFLFSLAELELTDRVNRRIERHIRAAKLIPGKTLDGFDFDAIPTLSKPRVLAFASEDSWVRHADNLLLFGPSGVGKSHLASAIGLSLVESSLKVLFTRTSCLVQKLQAAERNLELEAMIARLDKFHLLILDDFTHIGRDQAQSSVLFELISHRYELRSILITANQPIHNWEQIFPDKATAVAVADRLVHHGSFLELKGQSYRYRTAMERHRNGDPSQFPLQSPDVSAPASRELSNQLSSQQNNPPTASRSNPSVSVRSAGDLGR